MALALPPGLNAALVPRAGPVLPGYLRAALKLLVVPQDGWFALNRVNGQYATFGASASLFGTTVATPYGLAIPVTSSGTSFPKYGSTQFISSGTTKYTILVIANPDVQSSVPRPLFSQRHPGGGVNQATLVADSAIDFVTYTAGKLSLVIDTGNGFEAAGVVTGNIECYAIAVDGTRATMYRSGTAFAATVMGVPTAPWVSGQDTNLGYHAGSNASLENNLLGLAVFDGVCVPDALMRALTANPWSLFQPAQRRAVLFAPAVATGPAGALRAPVRVTQPQGPARIDRSNALGARVLSAFLRGKEIVHNTPLPMGTGTFALTADQQGVMQSFDGSSYLDITGLVPIADFARPVTIAFFHRPGSGAPNFPGMLRITNPTGAGAPGFCIMRSTNANTYPFAVGYADAGALPVFTPTLDRTVGVAERFVVACAAGFGSHATGDYTLWQNRVKHTTSTTNTFNGGTGGGAYLGWDGTTDGKNVGLLDEFVIFDGVLTDAQVKSYYDNPWQIFARQLPLYFAAGDASAPVIAPGPAGLLRRTWQRKAQPQIPVALSRRYASEGAFAWTPIGLASVSGRSCLVGQISSFYTTAAGKAWQGESLSAGVYVTGGVRRISSPRFAMVAVLTPTSTAPANFAGFGDDGAATIYVEQLALNQDADGVDSAGNVRFVLRDTASGVCSASPTSARLTVGKTSTIVCALAGLNTVRMWIDGAEVAVTHTNTAFTANSGRQNKDWAIGNFNYGGTDSGHVNATYGVDGGVAKIALFARLEIPATLAAELAVNPWQLFAQQQQLLYLASEAAIPTPLVGTLGQWDPELRLAGWF